MPTFFLWIDNTFGERALIIALRLCGYTVEVRRRRTVHSGWILTDE